MYSKDYSDNLTHYGVKRRSGRYPWGSGSEPYLRSGDFLSRVESLKSQGQTESEIAGIMKLSTGMLRTQVALAGEERRQLLVDQAQGLRDKGMSLPKIAETMGYKNDSSVRSLLNTHTAERMQEAKRTADFLKSQIDEKGMIDVGKGIELELGVSKVKMDQALYMLEMDGYPIYGGGVPQINNPGKQTNLRVVCPPGTEHKEIYELDKVHTLNDYKSSDGGDSFTTLQYPVSVSSSRLAIRNKENGGSEKDGVIELRRGVKDLDLGDAHYAQVRILVDGDKYLKGMAVYADKMPAGRDIIFNSNKPKGTPMLPGVKEDGTPYPGVLKPIHTEDPNNPFGSAIKKNGQHMYIDSDGKKKLSAININREEGDWAEWKDKLPSQFLAKQNKTMIKQQLGQATDKRLAQYEEIMSMTNPTVKKHYLQEFALSCDKDAEVLAGAALPGQKYHVILPVNSIKDTEAFAPNYPNGTKISLVRFPHGGTFEIPTLTVNNRNKEALKVISSSAKDAIGITSKVAERLSGADYDGDFVLTIPNSKKVSVTSKPPLDQLKGFDTKMAYPGYKGMKIMGNTENQMGMISNLITDMTLKGATNEELSRAVKHSMVVIDAKKHKLNYKQSEKDNQIASLKEKYQKTVGPDGSVSYGVSSLLSRAKSPMNVVKRQGSPKVDPKTGDLIWKDVADPIIVDKKTGKERLRTQPSTKMMETKDAYTLSSGRPKEALYADYANGMKDLARKARLTVLDTKEISATPDAKKKYATQVKSLDDKLRVAETNSPKERAANIQANAKVQAAKQANPDLKNDKEHVRKMGQQELERARTELGARKKKIVIDDDEWQAIQDGAISPTKLRKIINNTDKDSLKAKAMPIERKTMSVEQKSRINKMTALGYTTAEIANRFGVSVSTIANAKKGEE